MAEVNKKGHAFSHFASDAFIPTLSDTVNLPQVSSGGLMIAGFPGDETRNIRVLTVDGTDVVIPVMIGHFKIIVQRIFLTNTSNEADIVVMI